MPPECFIVFRKIEINHDAPSAETLTTNLLYRVVEFATPKKGNSKASFCTAKLCGLNTVPIDDNEAYKHIPNNKRTYCIEINKENNMVFRVIQKVACGFCYNEKKGKSYTLIRNSGDYTRVSKEHCCAISLRKETDSQNEKFVIMIVHH